MKTDKCFVRNEGYVRPKIDNVEKRKADFRRVYNNDDNGSHRGSIWGMINSYSDYITHYTPERKTETALETQFVKTALKTPINNVIEIAESIIG